MFTRKKSKEASAFDRELYWDGSVGALDGS
jgi:hypothetical protein